MAPKANSDSRDDYRRLVELSPMPIAVHAKGILVFANEATVRMMAANSAEDLVGKSIMRFLHPDSHALVQQRVMEIYQQQNDHTAVVEEKFIRCDGEVITVEVVSSLVHYEGQEAIQLAARDVTGQRKAQAALKESEERFRQLADSMPQMVWTANPDGRIDYRNERWYDFTGYTHENSINDWAAMLHPDDRQRCERAWQSAVKSGRNYQIEYRFRDVRHPKRYHWFLSRAIAVRDQHGRITKWYGTSTDIDSVRRTSQRKKELEQLTVALTEQSAQLVALNNAKDEFISLASHQLRTPATGVKQYIGMALEGYAGNVSPKVRKFLQKAYESNERQITIVNDLLQVAQVDAGKVALQKEPIDLVMLTSSVIHEQMSRFAAREQTVTFKPQLANFTVMADPSRLRMVLENLVDNASKYTPEGRSISVRLQHTTHKALIVIQDKGVGIATADIDRIFRKFSRIDNPLSVHVGGSGLGLYWVKKIVDLHGGTVSVRSRPGHGSTFTVSLPIS